MTCRNCKHFAMTNYKAYCKKHCDYLTPYGLSGCPNFESKYQITTTRNPYIDEMHDVVNYCKADVAALTQWFGNNRKEYHKMFKMDKVKKVIFNPPATIVYWFDGTKTIVKAQNGEIFDKEKGFAMACAKKFFGNNGNYYNEFRKHGADKDGYSISVDTALIGKVVRSGIEDGVFSCTCELDPNIVDQLCELGNKTDHSAGLKTELTCDGPITEQHIEASVLDEKPVGADPIEFIEKIHKKWVQEPTEKAKAERIQKKKEYIDDIAVKAAVDCRLNVEVVESNDGDVEYVFSFMHDDNKYKRKHCIGHDEFDVYSQEYLGNRLECRIGVWLGELAKAGVEPEKKESE